MERLTKILEDGRLLAYPKNNTGLPEIILKSDPYYEVLRKLNEYEDMEEQGRLVKLPYKVGDTLYRVDIDPTISEHDIVLYRVDNIVLCDDGDILFKYDAYDGIICGLKSLTEGELYLDYYKVFLTMEQAEQALQAMKQEKS